MFIRIKTSPNTPKTAVQLVENVRQGNTVKQKIVRHFGFGINDEEIAALKNLALHYKASLSEQRKPSLFPKDSLLLKIEGSRPKAEEAAQPLVVNLRDLKEENRLCVGIHQTYGKLFEQLGFTQVISNPRRRQASVKMLLNMVMARIAKPGSKRGSVAMLEKDFGINLDVNAVYRMMDFIDDDAIKKTKTLSYQHTVGLLQTPINVVFYDCTTLYFESFTEDDLKQNGYSKDGKFNQSQVLLALMVTEAGLPIGYELYEGSKFEGHTIDDALKKIHQQYNISKVTFVADSGLLSSDNIEKFIACKQDFIVGARIKNMSKDITGQIVDTSSYLPLIANEKEQEDTITYKEIILPEYNLRLIVTHSPLRARKDKHDRETAIESLQKRLSKSPNPKSLLNNFGYKKFVTLQGEATLKIEESKIQEAQKWDGLHGIITNIAKDEQSPYEILQHYKGLWQVEETFRISKHDLQMRPIFHWTPKRIKAHVAICFMALMCLRTMEYKVQLQYKKMSPAAIRNVLRSIEVSVLKDYKTAKQYIIPSKASQDAKKIYQLLQLKYSDVPYQLK